MQVKAFWNRISSFGVKDDMLIETSRKIVLTNQLSYLSFSALTIMNFSFFIQNNSIEWLSFFAVCSILTGPLINKLGYPKFSSFMIATSIPVATLFFSSLSKTFVSPPIDIFYYIFPKLLITSFLILPLILIDSRNKVQLVLSIAISVFCVLSIDWINKLFGVGIDLSNTPLDQYQKINFYILLPIIVIILGFYFLNAINNKYETKILGLLAEVETKNEQLTEQNEEISTQNEKISTQHHKLEEAHQNINRINKDLTDSIVYAERIQKATLPDTNILKQYFNESFVYFKPKSIVSGDFYFIKETLINNRKCLIIAAADCTGHGVPGGFMSMLGISFLNEIIQKNTLTNAADILNDLRANIKSALNQTGKQTDQKDGMDMALGIYFPDEKIIEFAGAKNPLYLIRNNEVIIYKGDRMPIGIYLKEKPFTNHTISIEKNDIIYLFSDGVIDQMNENGKKFMTKVFRHYLLQTHNNALSKQMDLIDAKLNDWMTSSNNKRVEQTDDMLLIAFKIPEQNT